MFDTTSIRGGDCNIKVNAISGTLVKNYQKSFVKMFHGTSDLAEMVFSETPVMKVRYDFKNVRECVCDGYNIYGCDVVVIQTMILPDNYYLCEIMWKHDFDEMFTLISIND